MICICNKVKKNKRCELLKKSCNIGQLSFTYQCVALSDLISVSVLRTRNSKTFPPQNFMYVSCLYIKGHVVSVVISLNSHLNISMRFVAVKIFLLMQYHHLHLTYFSLSKFPLSFCVQLYSTYNLSSSVRNTQQSRKPFAY